ncbi:hypothetical protein FJT64_010455 [Amphibalanus amphitrite]|uniref:Uncharacterized protein n=1 Tax=Amphibalanus amphitrite TaxID=1232801 RepID=A0A6A4V9Y6_AMPAM|nr:hypothetical protein FJT64_010455 [Amphibalanus amphitrite]
MIVKNGFIVGRYDHERAREERELLDRPDGGQATFVQKQMRAAAGRGTVEDRLKSNRYNIQRSAAAMDKSFVRR